jgi:hypothetical protein
MKNSTAGLWIKGVRDERAHSWARRGGSVPLGGMEGRPVYDETVLSPSNKQPCSKLQGCLFERSKSSIDYIQEARMTISIESNLRRRHESSNFFESPFECQTIIIDDRNKEYCYSKKGWWYPEKEVDFADDA